MCGICGVVGLGTGLPPHVSDSVPRMAWALRHRGPDGEGFYRHENAVFGHRRLSIIDRACGAQPMCNEDRTIWVVFNGEIYNHRDFRARLIAKGHSFRSVSDTETILHGYEEFGESVVEHLDGMFAFAMHDERTGQVLLARDRVGKKPLFYAVLGNVLHFASEIKSIRQSPLWDGALDPDALESYLSLGYVLAPRTIYRHVRKLMPGHTLTIAGGVPKVRRYWDVPEFDTDSRAEAGVLDDVDRYLSAAVRARLESEVPLGAFLSGGIDSGLVVSYMTEVLSSVTTTSVGFGDPAHNELEAAGVTATHLRTSHHPAQVAVQVEDVIGSIAAAFDEPFADASAVPTHYVSGLARQHVTVALSGDGGDEVFGGYGFRYVPHLLEEQARRVLHPLGLASSLRALGRAWPRGSAIPRWLRLGTFIDNIGGSAADAYYADLCFLKPRPTQLLMGLGEDADHRARESYAIVSDRYRSCPSKDPVQKAQYADLHVYLPNDPLVKVDRMSMAHGLEVRAPLLDHHLIEKAFTIPRTTKLKGLEAKHVLRALARRRLPGQILDLPKHGFTAPVSQWVRDRAPMLQEKVLSANSVAATLVDVEVARRWLSDHVSERIDHGYAMWALWMLQEWHDNCSAVTEPDQGSLADATARSVQVP
jgi:asparagine synthase (glutamine-hydrolysing)